MRFLGKSDKRQHFIFSYATTLTALLFLSWWGVFVGVLLGVGKEVYDYFDYGRDKEGFFKDSLGDLVADALGIVMALIILCFKRIGGR